MQDFMLDVTRLLASGSLLHFVGGAIGAASSCYDRAGRVLPFGLISGLVVCMIWQGMDIFGGFDVGNKPMAFMDTREVMQFLIMSALMGAGFAWMIDQGEART